MAAEPFDLIGVGVRGAALNSGRQIDDSVAALFRLPHVEHSRDDVKSEIGFRVDEDLRRVLVTEIGVRQDGFGCLHNGLGSAQRNVLRLCAAVAVKAEDDRAEHRGRRVVHVDGGLVRADERFGGALNEVFARLGQNRDAHIIRDHVLFDDVADKVEVRLAGCGESDFDFLEADLHQQFEHLDFAFDRHGVDESLVSVTQIGREPARGAGQTLVRPRAVGHVKVNAVEERLVLRERHGAWLLQIRHVISLGGLQATEQH